jgi:hypothetical protein
MRNGNTTASFTLPNLADKRTVEVIGENRTLTSQNGAFTDSFGPWDLHLYRIR